MNRERVFIDRKTVEPANSTDNVTRRILKSDGNGLRISIINLLCLLLAFAVLFIGVFSTLFFDTGEEVELTFEATVVMLVSTLVLLVGFIFVFLPFISGVLNFVRLTVDGERPSFFELFWSYKSAKRYFRSIAVAFVIILRIMLIALPFVGGIIKLPVLGCDGTETSFLITLADSAFVICSALAAMVVGAYLSSYIFFVPYLMTSYEKGFFSAIVASIHLGRGRRVEIVRMFWRSFGYAVLSALSFMVLWVIYAMPRISVSYFVYCNKVTRDDHSI